MMNARAKIVSCIHSWVLWTMYSNETCLVLQISSSSKSRIFCDQRVSMSFNFTRLWLVYIIHLRHRDAWNRISYKRQTHAGQTYLFQRSRFWTCTRIQDLICQDTYLVSLYRIFNRGCDFFVSSSCQGENLKDYD